MFQIAMGIYAQEIEGIGWCLSQDGYQSSSISELSSEQAALVTELAKLHRAPRGLLKALSNIR